MLKVLAVSLGCSKCCVSLASNILVHQHCSCQSPLLCKCPGDDGGVVYVLGDLDLLCLETECSPYGQEYWEKMARHDPAGTMGMKPPEVLYVHKGQYDICREFTTYVLELQLKMWKF